MRTDGYAYASTHYIFKLHQNVCLYSVYIGMQTHFDSRRTQISNDDDKHRSFLFLFLVSHKNMNCRFSNYTGIRIKTSFCITEINLFSPFPKLLVRKQYLHGDNEEKNDISTAQYSFHQSQTESPHIIFSIIACYCSEMDASKDHGTIASMALSSQMDPQRNFAILINQILALIASQCSYLCVHAWLDLTSYQICEFFHRDELSGAFFWGVEGKTSNETYSKSELSGQERLCDF